MKPNGAGNNSPAFRVLFGVLPIIYGLVFFIYVVIVTGWMRRLMRPDALSLCGIASVAWFIATYAPAHYRRLLDGERKKRWFARFPTYSLLSIAAAFVLIFAELSTRTFGKLYYLGAYMAILFVYIALTQAAAVRGGLDSAGSGFFSSVSNVVSHIFFYYNLGIIYYLISKIFPILQDSFFYINFTWIILWHALTRLRLYSMKETDGRFGRIAKISLAVATLVIFYLYALIAAGVGAGRFKIIFLLAAAAIYFVPIFILERRTAGFEKRFRKEGRPPLFGGFGAAAGVTFLFILFFFWAVYFVSPPKDSFLVWSQSHVTYALAALSLFIYARPGVAVFNLLALALLYSIVWLRFRRARLFFAVAAPLLFLFANYIVFYWDIAGGVSAGEVLSRPGVSLVCEYPSTTKGTPPPAALNSSTRFPRSLRLDPEKRLIFVSFGSIYGNTKDTPSVMSSDFDGREIRTLSLKGRGSKLIRDFHIESGADDIFISTWQKNYKMYRVDRESLKIPDIYEFESLADRMKYYDTYDVIPQTSAGRVFLFTGQPPVVIRFNLGAGGDDYTITTLDLTRAGGLEFGSILHRAAYEPSRNVIYAIAVTGDQGGALFEIDPDSLKVLRKANFPDIVISVEPDPIRNEILLACGLKKKIIAVDMDSFKAVREYKIPIPTVRNIIADTGRGRVFLVDHLRGRVFVMDRGFKKILGVYNVGNKPIGMELYNNSLFAASTLGVVRIDLDAQHEKTETMNTR